MHGAVSIIETLLRYVSFLEAYLTQVRYLRRRFQSFQEVTDVFNVGVFQSWGLRPNHCRVRLDHLDEDASQIVQVLPRVL